MTTLAEKPKPLIRPMEVTPKNSDVQKATKRLRLEATTIEATEPLIAKLGPATVPDSHPKSDDVLTATSAELARAVASIQEPENLTTSEISDIAISSPKVVHDLDPDTVSSDVPRPQEFKSNITMTPSKQTGIQEPLQYDPENPKVTGPVYKPTPRCPAPLPAPDARPLKPVRPPTTPGTPLMDESPLQRTPRPRVIIAGVATPEEVERELDDSLQAHLRRGRAENTGHVRLMMGQSQAQHHQLVDEMVNLQHLQGAHLAASLVSLPSTRARLADVMDNFFSLLAPYHNHEIGVPTHYLATCPKCQVIEQNLVAAIQASAPQLLDPLARCNEQDLRRQLY